MLKLRERARGRSSRKLQLIFARSSSTERIRVRPLPFGRFDTGAPRAPDESLNSLSPSHTASQKHPGYNEGFPLLLLPVCPGSLPARDIVSFARQATYLYHDIGKLLLFHKFFFFGTVKRQKLANTDGSHVGFDLLVMFALLGPISFLNVCVKKCTETLSGLQEAFSRHKNYQRMEH